MGQEKYLSVLDIASELNTGKATINYLLKRFEDHIPCSFIEGQPLYPEAAVPILICIQKEIDAGSLPTQIEEKLANGTLTPSDTDTSLSNTISQLIPEEDIKLSSHGLTVLKTVFNEISEQQQRIAKAHEDRAKAEERKAVAIEKRAEAEDKKAAAMNNIAHALQEMNRLRSSDAEQQIAHEAAAIIATDDAQDMDSFQDDMLDGTSFEMNESKTDELDTDINSLLDEDDLLDDFPSSDVLSDELDPDKEVPSHEVEEDQPEDDIPLDDLSSLLDEDSTVEDDEEPDQPLDDLSSLLDEPIKEPASAEQPIKNNESSDLDNLYDLIDEIPETEDSISTDVESLSEPLDDLSSLLDEDMTQDSPESDTKIQQPASELDDLSALIDQNDEQTPPADDDQLDDLSALISDSPSTKTSSDSQNTEAASQLDDLSALIATDTQDDSPAQESQPEKSNSTDQLDDLSKLIEAEPEDAEKPDQPAKDTITIDISPEDDVQAYKAAVMQIILKLKQEDGLSEEQTTEKLNANKIKTLSGKPKWSQKAISQIYKFIDSAK